MLISIIINLMKFIIIISMLLITFSLSTEVLDKTNNPVYQTPLVEKQTSVNYKF
jgi:hypothetical protein